MPKISLIIIALFTLSGLKAQDTAYVRQVADSLASPYMAGRGYNEQGTLKAATYIMGELKRAGAQPISETYFQDFTIPINTIHGDVTCIVDGKALVPGSEFLISSFSKRSDFSTQLLVIPKNAYKSVKKLKKFLLKAAKQNWNYSLVIDLKLAEDKDVKNVLKQGMYENVFPGGLISTIYITDGNLWWHVSRAFKPKEYKAIHVKREAWPANASEMAVRFESMFYEEYPTQNVCAFIPGKSESDSFIVFTAHYDHLGMMGDEVYFPGCNDNGSGVAMLLDLARYYAVNGSEYNIAFIFLSAEETGLKGAFHFAENPLIDLESIRLLINLDMVGSGSEGITLVNGTVYKAEFNRIKAINDEKGYLPSIKARGESFNSDHAPFHQKGVPSFFIYTRGKEYREYHTITDDGPLPLTGYEGLFKLLIDVTQY